MEKPAPTDLASSSAWGLMSRIVTRQPWRLNTEAACRPVTPAPMTSAEAALSEAAAVISCGAIREECARAYKAAAYPRTVFWALKISILWATDVRGTRSKRRMVIFCGSSESSALRKSAAISCFGVSMARKSADGGRICNNNRLSAYISPGVLRIFAPAEIYSLSVNPAFCPNPFSSNTVKPPAVSFFTTEGTRATLVSSAFCSFIEPIIIKKPLF